jgi:DNA-binding MarR family transcriptional regulator
VDQRVTEGLVSRSPDPDDRRRLVLALTPAGRALLDELAASRTTMLEEVTADWTSADIVALERLLLRLTTDFAILEEPDRA